jgi:hypothetical protein
MSRSSSCNLFTPTWRDRRDPGPPSSRSAALRHARSLGGAQLVCPGPADPRDKPTTRDDRDLFRNRRPAAQALPANDRGERPLAPLEPGWELRRQRSSWFHRRRALAIPKELFQHRAILYTSDHQPFSEVEETYQGEVLAFLRE